MTSPPPRSSIRLPSSTDGFLAEIGISSLRGSTPCSFDWLSASGETKFSWSVLSGCCISFLRTSTGVTDWVRYRLLNGARRPRVMLYALWDYEPKQSFYEIFLEVQATKVAVQTVSDQLARQLPQQVPSTLVVFLRVDPSRQATATVCPLGTVKLFLLF